LYFVTTDETGHYTLCAAKRNFERNGDFAPTNRRRSIRLVFELRSAESENVPKDMVLVVLSVVASALFWWPLCIQPNLGVPHWIPLVLIAVSASSATALSRKHWARFMFAFTVGTFVGLSSGYAIWPNPDGIAASYEPLTVLAMTVLAAFVSLLAGLVARKVLVQNETGQHSLWVLLLCCTAFGPIALALTPPLVVSRVARNDRLAAERFAGLKNAVETTRAGNNDRSAICNGQVLKDHYTGPPFSGKDWHYIVGNYVKADGYVFGIYCHEQGGYTIDAFPDRAKGDGSHRFCADESGRVGCETSWNRSRYACIPCSN
jgi:hypothetical protein